MIHRNPESRASLAEVLASEWFNPVATLANARALFLTRNLQTLNLGTETDAYNYQTTIT